MKKCKTGQLMAMQDAFGNGHGRWIVFGTVKKTRMFAVFLDVCTRKGRTFVFGRTRRLSCDPGIWMYSPDVHALCGTCP